MRVRKFRCNFEPVLAACLPTLTPRKAYILFLYAVIQLYTFLADEKADFTNRFFHEASA